MARMLNKNEWVDADMDYIEITSIGSRIRFYTKDNDTEEEVEILLTDSQAHEVIECIRELLINKILDVGQEK